jgi:hypothetical protein
MIAVRRSKKLNVVNVVYVQKWFSLINKAGHYVALCDTPVNGRPSLFSIDSHQMQTSLSSICWSINLWLQSNFPNQKYSMAKSSRFKIHRRFDSFVQPDVSLTVLYCIKPVSSNAKNPSRFQSYSRPFIYGSPLPAWFISSLLRAKVLNILAQFFPCIPFLPSL